MPITEMSSRPSGPPPLVFVAAARAASSLDAAAGAASLLDDIPWKRGKCHTHPTPPRGRDRGPRKVRASIQSVCLWAAMQTFKAMWKRSSNKGDKQAVSGTEEYCFGLRLLKLQQFAVLRCMLDVCVFVSCQL